MKRLENKKIALVHDFLIYPGGAEKVLKVFSEMFPEAPIYTLLYDEEKMRGIFEKGRIHTSFLQRFPKWLRKRHRWMLPFYATAVETLDLRDYDVVISSSGAWSKGLITKLRTQHIAYIHSPMRYVWDYNEKYWKNLGKKPSLCVKLYLHYLRVWDRLAADRPDHLIANSQYTRERMLKYYRRDSSVVYPPAGDQVESVGSQSEGLQSRTKDSGYFLIVSRLTENKRIDIAIDAFDKLGLPLKIIGEGPARKRLEKHAGDNISFLGWVDDAALKEYYNNARAFVHTAEEDFGIAIVEAMQFGVPIIAYGEGAAREIVSPGRTGEFFDAQVPGIVADAVRRFLENEGAYKNDVIRSEGEKYSREKFEDGIMRVLENVLNDRC